MKKRSARDTLDPVDDAAYAAELAELREQSRRVLRRLTPPDPEYRIPAEWTPWRMSTSIYTQTRASLIRQQRLAADSVPAWPDLP